MSQENVELLYRGADAFNRRDLDAYLALMDDDVELIPRAVALEGGNHYHGHDGVRRWWRDLFDVFPDFTAEVVGAQGLGDDLTLTRLRQRAHGAGSDTPTDEKKAIAAGEVGARPALRASLIDLAAISEQLADDLSN